MNEPAHFPVRLRDRAERTPDREAVVYLAEQGVARSLTYGQLWERACAVARALVVYRSDSRVLSRQRPESPRVMLWFPPGLDFLTAFLGTQLAGWVPVPTTYPKPQRANPRLESSAKDCDAAMLLSDAASLAAWDEGRSPAVAQLPYLAVDRLSTQSTDAEAIDWERVCQPDQLALLQYTSGSTSQPKGVKISHQNLGSNLEAIRTSFRLDDWISEGQSDPTAAGDPATAVFWLPHFHDMGLIGGLLAPLHAGYRAVLMSPQAFVREPLRWLEAVSTYRARVTGAPNFAFDLCAQRATPGDVERLDLASLRVLFCGAEPILPATLRRFQHRFEPSGLSANCFFPCYGLAEATLLAAGGSGPGPLKVLDVERQALADGLAKPVWGRAEVKTVAVVSCGRAVGDGQLLVVDPATGEAFGEQRVGEIWLRGSSVSAGYWNATTDDASRFGARLAPNRGGLALRWFGGSRPPEAGYFRTGDLGFLHEGELYVTGRLKELIIVRGRNYFPQDIEATVAGTAPEELGRAVAVRLDASGVESLGLVVEVSRHLPKERLPGLARRIRGRVIEEHELDPSEVMFVRQASIPLTTSGKVQRLTCQAWFADRAFACLYRWQRNGGAELPPLEMPVIPADPSEATLVKVRDALLDWIVQWLVQRGGVDPSAIDLEARFDEYGLDSLLAIRLIGDLEDCCGVELTPVVAWERPTIADMAGLIAARICGIAEDDQWQRGESPVLDLPPAELPSWDSLPEPSVRR